MRKTIYSIIAYLFLLIMPTLILVFVVLFEEAMIPKRVINVLHLIIGIYITIIFLALLRTANRVLREWMQLHYKKENG